MRPALGRKFIKGVFGIDAAFDGVIAHADVALREPQRLTHGDGDLKFDDVQSRDFRGNGMLDLDAFVDFQEVEIALFIDEEFDGAGIGVMGGFGDADGSLAHFLAKVLEFCLDERGGRLFDQFLVAPLDGTIALAQMNNIAPAVAEDLKLNVVAVLDVSLNVNAGISEGLFCLAPRGVITFHERNVVMERAHFRVRRRPAMALIITG